MGWRLLRPTLQGGGRTCIMYASIDLLGMLIFADLGTCAHEVKFDRKRDHAVKFYWGGV